MPDSVTPWTAACQASLSCILVAIWLRENTSCSVPDKDGIIVISLTGQDVPVIKTRRFAYQMPLPHHRRLVAAGLEQLRKRLLASVENAVFVVGETVLVAVLAGKQAGPRRAAERIGYETVGETRTLLRQPVDVGRVDATSRPRFSASATHSSE